jgi:glycosyltransferase involved in cell wall biosynthesis
MISYDKVAVLIPSFNEEQGILKVIEDVKQAMPKADIYVYDNNSTDKTATISENAGAIVCFERRQGKGHVVRQMFRDIDADMYIMVDGDGSYDSASMPRLLSHLKDNHLDMVIGTRVPVHGQVHRAGHAFGNKLFNMFLKFLFGGGFSDIFSGFRVFSRRFVKSFPAASKGFEIETEMSIFALELNLPTDEVETPFYERAEGSHSKLHTFKDGFKILKKMLTLCRDVRPLFFFGMLSLCHVMTGILLGLPIISEFLQTSKVPRFPTAILASSIVVLGVLWFLAGVILDSIARGRKETKQLFYLSK